MSEPAEKPAAEPGFEELANAVDRAARAVADLDGDAERCANDLKDAIEAFHRPALVHIVRCLRDDPRGKELLFELVDEPSVRAVLSLHGIIRADPMTRARKALEDVRPYLQSHGGDVELLSIENGVATVRLDGACSGCSMSAVTLREGVEKALEVVEEIERVAVADEPTAALVNLSSRDQSVSEDNGWFAGPRAEEVPGQAMLRFGVHGDATALQGPEHAAGAFIVVNIDNRFSVFRNACPHQGLALDTGSIEQGVLTCPWHGFQFDASSGECLTAPSAQLEQVPTRIVDGRVWIRPT